jgi:hypothetical protein
VDLYTKLELRTFINSITEISDSQVVFNGGSLVTDLFGNAIRTPNGWKYTSFQQFIQEYVVGKKWSTRYKVDQGAMQSEAELEFRVVAREPVNVPAGTFNAFRVEGEGWARGNYPGSVLVRPVYWIAPGVRRPIANEIFRKHSSCKVLANERVELTAYKQA